MTQAQLSGMHKWLVVETFVEAERNLALIFRASEMIPDGLVVQSFET